MRICSATSTAFLLNNIISIAAWDGRTAERFQAKFGSLLEQKDVVWAVEKAKVVCDNNEIASLREQNAILQKRVASVQASLEASIEVAARAINCAARSSSEANSSSVTLTTSRHAHEHKAKQGNFSSEANSPSEANSSSVTLTTSRHAHHHKAKQAKSSSEANSSLEVNSSFTMTTSRHAHFHQKEEGNSSAEENSSSVTMTTSRRALFHNATQANISYPTTKTTTSASYAAQVQGPAWITVFTELPGSGNEESDEDSPERTLSFPFWEAYVAGQTFEVRLSWPSGWIQFLVPAGENIFEQNANLNIPIQDVSTSGNFEPSFGSTALFCHACVQNGTRYGDTCWAVVPSSNNYRSCGCDGGGWAGEGIYYGGSKDPDVCLPEGGGFAGPKLNGEAKGNLSSIGLKLQIRLQEDAIPESTAAQAGTTSPRQPAPNLGSPVAEEGPTSPEQPASTPGNAATEAGPTSPRQPAASPSSPVAEDGRAAPEQPASSPGRPSIEAGSASPRQPAPTPGSPVAEDGPTSPEQPLQTPSTEVTTTPNNAAVVDALRDQNTQLVEKLADVKQQLEQLVEEVEESLSAQMLQATASKAAEIQLQSQPLQSKKALRSIKAT